MPKRRLCVTGQNNVARMARVCPVRLFLEATGACTFLRFQAKPHSLGTGGELDARNGDEEFFGVTVDHIQLPRCMPRMAEGLSAAYSSNGHKTHLGRFPERVIILSIHVGEKASRCVACNNSRWPRLRKKSSQRRVQFFVHHFQKPGSGHAKMVEAGKASPKNSDSGLRMSSCWISWSAEQPGSTTCER